MDDSRQKPKPVIKVYLLPLDWTEERKQELHTELVKAAMTIPRLEVADENDLITVFPKDSMEKGLGREILVEVDVPDSGHITLSFENTVAAVIGRVAQDHFPDAYVQCKTYKFDPTRGFWNSESQAET